MGNPFTDGAMPRLEYVLKGIKRVESQSGTQWRVRLPITIDILHKLRDIWLCAPRDPDRLMLWAATCVGFFGFLRAGEFTVPSEQAYNPEIHLSLGDLSIDSHSNPSAVCIHIKQSKTDPFRQGVDIFLGRTNTAICPITAIINYIGIRPKTPGPLFMLQSGKPLSRAYLVHHLKQDLHAAGLPEAEFNGHSFRIGAATTAARQGLEDSLIQTLGRWRSEANKAYIKIPRAELANVSRVLAK